MTHFPTISLSMLLSGFLVITVAPGPRNHTGALKTVVSVTTDSGSLTNVSSRSDSPTLEQQGMQPGAFENRVIQRIDILPPPEADGSKPSRAIPADVEQLVRATLRSRQGQPYSQRSIEQDISSLHRLGRFQRIEVKIQPSSDESVVLTFIVDEQKLIREVKVSGNQSLTTDELLDTANVLSGTPIDVFLIERVRRRIEQTYRYMGFASVDVRLDERALSDLAVAHFQVREGSRVTIAKAEHQGVPDSLAPAIEVLMRCRGLWTNSPLVRDAVETLQADTVELFCNEGYLDAQVVARSMQKSVSSANILLSVSPGERATVGQVRIEWLGRNQAIPDARVIEDAHAKQFAGAPLTRALLEQFRTSLRTDLGTKGYASSSVTSRLLRRPDVASVDVLLITEPGPRHRLGKILVTGTQDLRTAQVLSLNRDIQFRDTNTRTEAMSLLVPGEQLDSNKIERFSRLLRSSPWCGHVDIKVVPVAEDVQDPEPVADLFVSITERPYLVDTLQKPKPVARGQFQPTQIDWSSLPLPSKKPSTALEDLTRLATKRDGQGFRKRVSDWLTDGPMPEEPLSLLIQGDAELLTGKWYEALGFYERVQRDFSESPEAIAAGERYIALADSFQIAPFINSSPDSRVQSEPDLVVEMLIRLQERFPGTALGERAGSHLVDIFILLGEYEQAIDAASRFRVEYPRSARRSEMMRMLIHMLASQYKRPGDDLSPLREAVFLARRSELELDGSASDRGDNELYSENELHNRLVVAEVADRWILLQSLSLPLRDLVRARAFLLQRLVREVPEALRSTTIQRLVSDPDLLIKLPPVPITEFTLLP